jgi:hypothetical protein
VGLFDGGLGPGTLGRAFYEENRRAAFGRAAGLGLGQNPRARFLREAFPQFEQWYQGEIPHRGPDWSFVDALGSGLGGLETMFANLPAEQRGLDPGKFSQPVRWLL